MLSAGAVDFSIFWRRLSHAVGASAEQPHDGPAWAPVRDLFLDGRAWLAWQQRYTASLVGQDRARTGAAMLKVNPKYVLRNHLGETAIRQAQAGDFSEVDNLLAILRQPLMNTPTRTTGPDFRPIGPLPLPSAALHENSKNRSRVETTLGRQGGGTPGLCRHPPSGDRATLQWQI